MPRFFRLSSFLVSSEPPRQDWCSLPSNRSFYALNCLCSLAPVSNFRPPFVSFIQTCLVVPIISPLTLLQSILLSSGSSTNPTQTTLSPLIRYNPWLTSELASSSSCDRMMRSMVSERTRLVTWSQERSVPISVRPSIVMTRIFSA